MKFRKIASAIVLALIMIACSFSMVFADSGVYATVEAEGEMCRGEEIEICVNIFGGRGIRGIAVVPVFVNDAFSLVSGKWIVNGAVSDFSIEEGNGVIAFDSPVDLDGTILTFVISAIDSAELGNYVVSAEVIMIGESGRHEISTEGVTIEIKCDHSGIGGWKSDADSHWCECACGYKTDAEAHAWNEGAVTKDPTETEAGEKTYICSICGKDRAESIGKLEESPRKSAGFIILAVVIAALFAMIFLMKYKGITFKSPTVKNEEMTEKLAKFVPENDEKSENLEEDIAHTDDEKIEDSNKDVVHTEDKKEDYIDESVLHEDKNKESPNEDGDKKEAEKTESSSNKDITKEETSEYLSGENSVADSEVTEPEAEVIENASLEKLNQNKEDTEKDISEEPKLDVEECATEEKTQLASCGNSEDVPISTDSTDGG